MNWILEQPAFWDETKQKVLGANKGAFDIQHSVIGGQLEGTWWRLMDNSEVVGYGWIHLINGTPEISIAVDVDKRNSGYGNIILRNLEEMARMEGFTWVECVIRSENTNAIKVIEWFHRRQFIPVWLDEEISVEAACSYVFRTDVTMRKNL